MGVSAAVLVGHGCVRAWVTGLPWGRALCKGRVPAGLMVGTGLLLRYEGVGEGSGGRHRCQTWG